MNAPHPSANPAAPLPDDGEGITPAPGPAAAALAFDAFTRPVRKTETPGDINVVLDIPVRLTVELGRTKITVKDMLEFAMGTVIELDGLAGEPMDVLINDCLIAQGEVVVVNEKFGIRLTDITNPSERLRNVKK